MLVPVIEQVLLNALLSLRASGHLPTSCREVQSMTGFPADGEQILNVQGKALKVKVLHIAPHCGLGICSRGSYDY